MNKRERAIVAHGQAMLRLAKMLRETPVEEEVRKPEPKPPVSIVYYVIKGRCQECGAYGVLVHFVPHLKRRCTECLEKATGRVLAGYSKGIHWESSFALPGAEERVLAGPFMQSPQAAQKEMARYFGLS